MIKSSSARIAESEVMASFSRRKSGAASTVLCIKAARTTEGDDPATGTNSQTAIIAKSAAGRFLLTRLLIKPTRKATCIPDTATICKIPARDISA